MLVRVFAIGPLCSDGRLARSALGVMSLGPAQHVDLSIYIFDMHELARGVANNLGPADRSLRTVHRRIRWLSLCGIEKEGNGTMAMNRDVRKDEAMDRKEKKRIIMSL